MIFGDRLVVVRGGGDLASGAIVALRRAGFPVVVLELARPLAIRRTVAFSTAVLEGEVEVERVRGVLADSAAAAVALAGAGTVPVLVAPRLPAFDPGPDVVVDGRLAKERLDTTRADAELVVALGPGFVAGTDCHAVIETMRGPRLGRVIWEGTAADDTGVPGVLGGRSSDRVVRAPVDGEVAWRVRIGDLVAAGELLGSVGGEPVESPLGGVVRGLIAPGFPATPGLKIGDVDPRGDPSLCLEVSDKARLVGAGVLEAVLTWLNRL
jgi:xanthine dehydrogenase accessory factor